VTGGRGGDTGWLVALCVARAGASVMSMAFPTVLAAVQTEWGLSNRAAGSISSASQAGTHGNSLVETDLDVAADPQLLHQ